MAKIIGNTTATPNPRPDWLQDDAAKADYIKNKPTLGTLSSKDKVAKTDLAADVQASLDKADLAETKTDALTKLTEAKTYADEGIGALNEGFSNVIYQMYGNDITENGAPTIRGIANDEATTVLQSYKETVPSWAKASTKPTYTANEVGAVSYTAQTLTEEQKAQARSNIGAGDSAFSGSYNDLTDKPTIPAAYTLPAAGSSLGGVKTGGDVSISNGVITVNDDSHNHTIDNVDGLQAALNGKEASGAVSTHNTSTSAHNDIRTLITNLTTRLNTLANSDDTTLDQMSEIVAYIKSNKTLIEEVTTNKVNVSDIVNNLTTNVTNKPLSAAQGVTLKALIDNLDAAAVGALPSNTAIPDALADLTSDSTHRTVTDAEKATWNAKSNFSGNYNDLTNKPTIPAAYSHPTAHPASMITGLATVATSGSYNDLSNKPTIPTVNNATLTIQKNGTNVATFTANSSTNATANITVPTGAAADKGVDTSISAGSSSTNLPTSKAVAAFVEGKGYKTTDNNTTYTVATGDSNGQIKVTPSSGSAYNVSVKGLGSAAYTASTAYAAASHGTHVSYSSTAPVMDGTASVGTASTVARSDHKHPTDTSRAAKSDFDTHVNNKSNPHGVTKSQVGLGNVDNTSDANKPVSTAQAEALATKADKTSGVYYIVGNSTTEGVWTGTCEDIDEYYDGLMVAYKPNIAGASGLTLNINGLGAVSVIRNTSTAVTTHYDVGSVVFLVYTVDSDGVAHWKVSDYDSDTKARSSNKTGSKMFIIGATTQSSSGQTTYSNKNCYIGTDNCLYSNGKKVASAEEVTAALAEFAVSVKNCGAKGDGSTDDTSAIQSALAGNRKVYIPAGTYQLSGALVVRDNCELTLAQDAVLNFTQTSGSCITLNRSSSLHGNHATINVPHSFSGIVINVDTSVHTDTKDVPPWSHWDPQWKTARYMTDINICKADSYGVHRSTSGESNGTAIYICANGSATSTFIWGLNFSGVRIAGAFEYGIRSVSLNGGYNHEMRIEAFMDACKIGVSLEDCNNAYISATIQPRAAANDAVYAKHGIQLIRSENTDLLGSRVWDWNAKSSLWTFDKSNVNQHIAMYGDCRGTIMNDYNYHYLPSGFTDLRELIYTDTASNFDSLIILQEPLTKWFKPIDNVPYFNNGSTNKRLLLKEEQDALFDTEYVPAFDDKLSKASDGAGGIFNEIGYKRGAYWNVDGKTLTASDYHACTGYIPCHQGSVINVSGMSMAVGDDYCKIVLYDSNFNKIVNINRGNVISNASSYFLNNYTETDDGFSITSQTVEAAYMTISVKITTVSTKPAIAVDEEIRYTQIGTLASGVKVSESNLIGMDGYEKTGRMTTQISASSSDNQYPSAKAVYTAIQNFLGVVENGTY